MMESSTGAFHASCPLLTTSLEDLQSIHSLLSIDDDDTTNVSSNSKPLSGQKVMVPITTKAFFEGTLAPPTTTSTGNDDDGDTKKLLGSSSVQKREVKETEKKSLQEREKVLIKLGQGYLAEMTREKASDLIRRRLDQITTTSSIADDDTSNNREVDQPSKDKNNAKKKNLTMKKGFLNKTNKKNTTTTASNTKTTTSFTTTKSSPSVPSLPYFEIREEFDKDGNEIKAEALNMSLQLQDLQKKLKEERQGKKKDDDDDNDSNPQNPTTEEASDRGQIIGALLENIDLRQKDIGSGVVVAEDNNHKKSIVNSKGLEENESSKQTPSSTSTSTIDKKSQNTQSLEEESETKKVNKEEYSKILSRLDELALLEEKNETATLEKKNQNAKLSTSKQRLKGKGWTKGFLNSSNDGKKKNKNSAVTTKNTNTAKDLNTTTNQRKVQFKGSNEIKEIPRIGTIPVPQTIRSTAHMNLKSNNDVPAKSPPIAEEERTTFRNTVLNTTQDSKNNRNVVHNPKTTTRVSMGNITERDIVSTNATVSPPAVESTASSPNEEEEEVPTKKLSRFAQRRLEQRGMM